VPLYGFLLIAATASSFPFAGGGSLMGAQYPSAEAHPGAAVWAPRYILVSSLYRRYPSPDVNIETTALDPGRGVLAASVGARYRYEGAEQHLLGGALDLGLRLGNRLSVGLSGAYDSEIKWSDMLRYGLSYAMWPRRTSQGTQPGLITAVDYDSSRRGDGRWRSSVLVAPIEGMKACWDHRFDGSNVLAAAYRLGSLEIQASGSLLSQYSLAHYGFGLRFHDRGGWLGASWSSQDSVRHLSFEVTIPIGAQTPR